MLSFPLGSLRVVHGPADGGDGDVMYAACAVRSLLLGQMGAMLPSLPGGNIKIGYGMSRSLGHQCPAPHCFTGQSHSDGI